jgi:hypothetical protein
MARRVFPSFLIAYTSAFLAQVFVIIAFAGQRFDTLASESWVYLFAGTAALVAGCFGAAAYRRRPVTKFTVGTLVGAAVGGAAAVLPGLVP